MPSSEGSGSNQHPRGGDPDPLKRLDHYRTDHALCSPEISLMGVLPALNAFSLPRPRRMTPGGKKGLYHNQAASITSQPLDETSGSLL